MNHQDSKHTREAPRTDLGSSPDDASRVVRPRKDLDPETERLGGIVVDAAIQVHRKLGPGLLESVYESCLEWELTQRGLQVSRQVLLPIHYGTLHLPEAFRIDCLVEDRVILELKAVEHILPIHEAQLLTYLRLSGRHLGFLLNFNVPLMRDGIQRKIL